MPGSAIADLAWLKWVIRVTRALRVIGFTTVIDINMGRMVMRVLLELLD